VEVGALVSKESHSLRGEAVLVGGAGGEVGELASLSKLDEDALFWEGWGGAEAEGRVGLGEMKGEGHGSGPWLRKRVEWMACWEGSGAHGLSFISLKAESNGSASFKSASHGSEGLPSLSSIPPPLSLEPLSRALWDAKLSKKQRRSMGAVFGHHSMGPRCLIHHGQT
jgi:hypothetical protein